MDTKYKIGNLVTVKDFGNKVFKVVEVWEVGFYASGTGEVLPESLYVLSNMPHKLALVIGESDMEPILMPELPKKSELPAFKIKKNK